MSEQEQYRLEAAAAWRLRLDHGSDQGDTAEFLEWLRRTDTMDKSVIRRG
jgi:hypothetical protein